MRCDLGGYGGGRRRRISDVGGFFLSKRLREDTLVWVIATD